MTGWDWQSKYVVVAGGTGMIGRELCSLLLDAGARVRAVSLDTPEDLSENLEFTKTDLSELTACETALKGADAVFNLVGVKGSPAVTGSRPASFFTTMMLCNTSILEAARRVGAERYLYTSSIGVYAPSPRFEEDSVWSTFPSPHDRIPGWAKRMGELQCEAYRIEYGWEEISIVRPANVYGRYDNFDGDNAMVIPSLIKRALNAEDDLTVWGDGSAVRDFIHARDVARGMIDAVEQGYNKPVNLGSGKGVSIRELVEAIVAASGRALKIHWDTSKPTGDPLRLMDISRARRDLGFEIAISIKDGVADTVAWYAMAGDASHGQYSIFGTRT